MAKNVKSAGEDEPLGLDTEPVRIPEPGGQAVNDEFVAIVNSRGLVSVKPVGWVGEPPLQVSAFKVPALIAVLQELSAASEPEDD